MKELTPLENELSQLSLSRSLIIYSSKKLIYNKLRNSNNATTGYADPWKGYKMRKITALKGSKSNVRTLVSILFSSLCTHMSSLEFCIQNTVWRYFVIK